MTGRNINFDDKKLKKLSFTKLKFFLILMILMLIKY